MSHFLTKPIGKYTIFRKKKKALHADIEEARPTIPGGLHLLLMRSFCPIGRISTPYRLSVRHADDVNARSQRSGVYRMRTGS